MEWMEVLKSLSGSLDVVSLLLALIWAVRQGELVTKAHNQEVHDRAVRAETRAEKLEGQLADNNKILAEQIANNGRTVAMLEKLLAGRQQQ